MTDNVKILFLAASPTATAKLELDRENRTIKEKIRASHYADKIIIENEWAVRDDDLLLHMNVNHPNIVHFSGHGTTTGELIFEGENRSPKPISSLAMKSLFSNFKNYTHLVVLNACHTYIQAKAIAEDIDCVIGTNQAIGDETAINFISAFYEALGFGKSVEEAFQQGITQMMIKDLPEEQTPQLFTRPGIDASRITLTELAQISQPQTAPPQVVPEGKSAMSPQAINRPISIFISYAPEDKQFYKDMIKHFAVMKRNNKITIRHMENALGGSVGEEQLRDYLAADMVLLLISPDFISSDSLYDDELKPAMARRAQKLTWVIPILVRETSDWKKDSLIGGLVVLPRNKKPIANWDNRDQAIKLIMEEINRVIDEGLQKSGK